MAPIRRTVVVALVVAAFAATWTSAAQAATRPPVGSWAWPIEGRVARGFVPPPTPFSPGHRGIDIDAAFGTPVHAPADGVVSFAGFVAGELFVTIDHGDGYRSTDSWLGQALVRTGQSVKEGDVVALSGRGHPELPEDQIHFGVRIGDTYIDPRSVLAPQSAADLIRLAPLSTSGGTSDAGLPPGASRRWFSWIQSGTFPRPAPSAGFRWAHGVSDTGRGPPRLLLE